MLTGGAWCPSITGDDTSQGVRFRLSAPGLFIIVPNHDPHQVKSNIIHIQGGVNEKKYVSVEITGTGIIFILMLLTYKNYTCPGKV